jgi:hypothetical protein
LVVAVGVDDAFSDELAGDGVDDADVQVLGEHEDVGSGEGSAEADVVHAAVDAQGDAAGFVDAVVSDAFEGVGISAGPGQGFWRGLEEGCWGGLVGEGSVGEGSVGSGSVGSGSVGSGSVGSAVVVFVDDDSAWV